MAQKPPLRSERHEGTPPYGKIPSPSTKSESSQGSSLQPECGKCVQEAPHEGFPNDPAGELPVCDSEAAFKARIREGQAL